MPREVQGGAENLTVLPPSLNSMVGHLTDPFAQLIKYERVWRDNFW